MGCCAATAAGERLRLDDEESAVRRQWSDKWAAFSARVLKVLRARSGSDSAFGLVVRLYALEVGAAVRLRAC
jgi:hypothetical protein